MNKSVSQYRTYRPPLPTPIGRPLGTVPKVFTAPISTGSQAVGARCEVVLTINVTSWNSFKCWLKTCGIPCLLIQEHKMRTKDQMAAAEGLAYKQGWRIRWSPAIDSPNHSKYAVAGAAVLVKQGYGLFDLPESPSDVYTGFVAAGLVELFAGLPFMAYSTTSNAALGWKAEIGK